MVRLVGEKIFSLNHAMIRSGGSKRLMKKAGPPHRGRSNMAALVGVMLSGRFLHKNVAVPEPQCSPHLGIRWWAR